MSNYKVFISFKNTDNGAETKDSVMAAELYNVLTANHIPTFFSKVSILESGEGDYRNLIDAALDECSILIAVGTKKQYLTSRWVKYEYASFHEDILSGNKDSDKCTVCSYIADMEQRDLPRPLRNLQSFEDMDALVNFVKNHLKKFDIIETHKTPQAAPELMVSKPVTEEKIEPSDIKTAPTEIEIKVSAEDTEKTEKKHRKKKVKQEKNNKPKNKAKTKKIIIGAFAALVAVFVIWGVAGVIKDIGNSLDIPVIKDGETTYIETSIEDSYVSISSAVINADTMAAIEKMLGLVSISFTDCTFADDSYTKIANIQSLSSVTLKNVSGIEDFSFLNSPDCTDITVVNCGLTDDNHKLGESANITCTSLDLSENTELTDIGFVKSFTGLSTLKIDSTGVSDLSALQNHGKLNVLSFDNSKVSDISVLSAVDLRDVSGNNNSITDISPLAVLMNLESISFANNEITAITEKFASLRLSSIDLSENEIIDFTGFENLTVIEKLYVGITKDNSTPKKILMFAGASSVKGLELLIERNVETLTELDVSNKPLSTVALAYLSNASGLTYLDINGISVANLDFLNNCYELREIHAEGCGLTNIDGLSASSVLKNIYLANNSIKDATPLNSITESYMYIDLSDNELIVDEFTFSSSENASYSALLLYGNEITDLSFLTMLDISILGITYHDNIEPSQINCQVYVENLPEHRIVAYEDAIYHTVIIGRYGAIENESETS